ncbi:galactokinase [Chloroflexota bacterium]
MSAQQRVIEHFESRLGLPPALVVRAPGRVNLIGEHTDYNDGFVLPMTIDRAIWMALRPRQDRTVDVYSLDFDEAQRFSLDGLHHDLAGWAEYLEGVAWALQEAGYHLRGWEGVVSGDIPVGAGLSSSAALEMAAARAFATVSDLPWDAAAMAKIGQRAENQWVGVNCGIMDQMISAGGKADHALLIDCRSLETEAVPLPPDTSVVILDTGTRRGLVDSAYHERRAQCEAAARFFNATALRDVSIEQFESRAGGLPETVRGRARHVITENDRTLEAAEALRFGDAVGLGQLMNASHASLRDDFQVSSDELNEIVACAWKETGCLGARMTGAGFGGCAVALVLAGAAKAFARTVAACYEAASACRASIYICTATDGAEAYTSS